MSQSLSVVITTRNRKQDLLRLVNSLKQSTHHDFEIIIVDDQSTDGTELLNKGDITWNAVTIIHCPEQLMMVKARNVGARASRGNLVLFIDDDNVVPSTMIEQLLRCVNTHPTYGIIGPAIHYLYDRELKMSYQRFSFWTGRTTAGVVKDSRQEIHPSDGVPNAFLVRREVFERCGYFDETLFQTFTEPDFAFHASRDGIRCGMSSRAFTYHDAAESGTFKPRSLGGQYIQKSYFLMRNRAVLVARYGSLAQKVIYALFFSWFWPLIYSLIMIRYRRLDLIPWYWKGWRDGMIYLSSGRMVNSYI